MTGLADAEFEAKRARVVSRLFAIMTAKLEDAHGVAVRGQKVGLGHKELSSLAGDVVDIGNELVTLGEAVEVIGELLK